MLFSRFFYLAAAASKALAWKEIGGQFLGVPAVVSLEGGRNDVFVRSPTGEVLHKWQTGEGAAWEPAGIAYENLGGLIHSNVAAVSWGGSRIDIFGVASDNSGWHKAWNGSAWSAWETLGGRLIGEMSAVSWGNNRIDLFARNFNNTVLHKAWEDQWWPSQSAWEDLGGATFSSPKAVSAAPNTLDVFIKDVSNVVHQKTWNGRAWDPAPGPNWKNLGGVVMGDITPVSLERNQIDIFARATDNSISQKTWNGNQWLPSQTGWTGLGGKFASDLAAVGGAGEMTLSAMGQSNLCEYNEYSGSSWSGWRTLGGSITDQPALLPNIGLPPALVRGALGTLYISETSPTSGL